MRALYVLMFLVACSRAEPERAAPITAAAWFEADPEKSLGATLAEQAQIAVKNGKKPHAYLHAAWCPPCVEIEKTRGTNPKMRAAFAGVHIIAIDVDDIDVKQIEAAGMKAVVIPIFYRLDDKGVPTGTSLDGGAWGDNVPDNMAPPLTAYFSK
ncbi:MAG: hypothetical protein M4D80_20060 [Myxococcota bacterium]|nr:hypothetical protein [Myxococcota bacterium]